MSSLLYYERMIKELKEKGSLIDVKRLELQNLHADTIGDQVLFRKKSKELKEVIKALSFQSFKQESELLASINKRNKDWDGLLNQKLALSKIDSRKAAIAERHRKLRFDHYHRMAPFMKKKRDCKKEISETTGQILERIKNG